MAKGEIMVGSPTPNKPGQRRVRTSNLRRRDGAQTFTFSHLPRSSYSGTREVLHRPHPSTIEKLDRPRPFSWVTICQPTSPSHLPPVERPRLIGQWLSARLSQPFVIENRPGAGSNIGTEVVVNAPPDG